MPKSIMYTKSAVLNWNVTFSRGTPYWMLHRQAQTSACMVMHGSRVHAAA